MNNSNVPMPSRGNQGWLSGLTIVILSALVVTMSCGGGKKSDGSSAIALLFPGKAPASSAPVSVPTAPAAPGSGAPVLNTLVKATSLVAGVGKLSLGQITFQDPVSGQTAVTAFLGGPDMQLLPDATVVNSLQQQTKSVQQVPAFDFLVAVDTRYKIILVARNELGLSSKEFHMGHPHLCATADTMPAQVGDCNDHCVQGTRVGNTLNFKAKHKPKAGNAEDYFLDIFVRTIPLDQVAAFGFWDDPNQMPMEATAALDLALVQNMCFLVESGAFSENLSYQLVRLAIPMD